jgi:hypothetical protein
MANSLKYVREQANIHPTARNKAVETNIRVRAYDNGMVMVNENPMEGDSVQMNAIRFVAQMLEELFNEHGRRRRASAAAHRAWDTRRERAVAHPVDGSGAETA